MEFPGCYNSLPPLEDLVPRSRTIRGGGGREAGDDDLDTTNKGLCFVSTMNFCRDEFPQRDGNVGRTKPPGDKEEERQFKPTIKGSILTQSARILGKRTEVNRMTKMCTGVRRTKGTTGIPILSSESRQYFASKHCNYSKLHTLKIPKF